jgi:hypothetical protein
VKRFARKYLFQPFLFWVFLGLSITGLALPSASASVAEQPPTCHTVTFEQNSGVGPNFHGVKLCDYRPGDTALIVDGSKLQNGAVIFGGGAPAVATTATAATAATARGPGHIAGCFGNRGVEFGTFSAWLCEVKLGGDPSGSLYFTPSVDDGLNGANPGGQMVWYKLHAAPNAFYVWENYSEPWGTGDSPRANGRIIALDEGPAGQCILNWPSWTVTPTECTPVLNGGATVEPMRPLTPMEAYSVAEYIANARPAIPLEYR